MATLPFSSRLSLPVLRYQQSRLRWRASKAHHLERANFYSANLGKRPGLQSQQSQSSRPVNYSDDRRNAGNRPNQLQSGIPFRADNQNHDKSQPQPTNGDARPNQRMLTGPPTADAVKRDSNGNRGGYGGNRRQAATVQLQRIKRISSRSAAALRAMCRSYHRSIAIVCRGSMSCVQSTAVPQISPRRFYRRHSLLNAPLHRKRPGAFSTQYRAMILSSSKHRRPSPAAAAAAFTTRTSPAVALHSARHMTRITSHDSVCGSREEPVRLLYTWTLPSRTGEGWAMG